MGLLALLAELDTRKLYLGEGWSRQGAANLPAVDRGAIEVLDTIAAEFVLARSS